MNRLTIQSDESGRLTATDNWIGIDLAGSSSAATEFSGTGIASVATLVEGNEIAGGEVGIETTGPHLEERNKISATRSTARR